MKKILLIVLCFFLPPLAVLLHEGLNRKVLWALLWQLLGHFPGVIYGILVVTKDPERK
ncbi:YqaE/Pmp3 family membrane protein [Arthrobacter sp. KN11-1C]|uniref:YqaE/Pmp3 family membrane protein n=1 Tax=Arthrobacter sp. KN11-1C TaxID=3445774 RepID=UPI003FA09D4E